MTDIARRSILAGAAGAAMASGATALASPAQARYGAPGPPEDFGLVGDGVADDTEALQRAFETAFGGGTHARLVTLPSGTYRVTRPIHVRTRGRPEGNITQPAGLRMSGARIVSDIRGDRPVVRIDVRATLRYTLLEGLQIVGKGQEGPGLLIACERRGSYFYNFCLRDIVIEGCGGDGCRMTGNVFEGQIINSYFRDNGRDGAHFSHGPENTVFSAVHVFGCVFGGNRRNGVSMVDGATDVSFHGCYFLLNGKFGLSAEDGLTLLSHCGFENNHESAESFEEGDAGLRLLIGGTLVGCTAYSIFKQKHLVRGYITNRLVMIGCTGSGDEKAGRAGLATLKGRPSAAFTLIGCYGAVERHGVEVLELGNGEGVRFGERWDSPNLVCLGEHRLWVDGEGKLRVASGPPMSDTDGTVIGG